MDKVIDRLCYLTQIPKEAYFVLDILEKSGYEAYLVGGCVRDMVLDKIPHDWDITSNALPEQIMKVFQSIDGMEVKPTGIQHGTVTVCYKGHNSGIEVTTYRVDGVYTDHRRPDFVKFVTSLKDDLSRRDFTINALAMDLRGNIIDPFGGLNDIKRRVIRCVGNPDSRFNEDSLRIMRAFRFAAILGYTIDSLTAESMIRNKDLLKFISVERIQVELEKALAGRSASLFRQFYSVISVFWPEIGAMVGFNQNNPNHCYDVFEHTLHALDSVGTGNSLLALGVLLHDIGKPVTYSVDDNGVGHFYSHHLKGMDIAKDMLMRLKFSNNTIDVVCKLIKYHDATIEGKKSIRRMLNRLSEDEFRLLIKLKHADVYGQSESVSYRHVELDNVIRKLEEIKESNEAITLKDLAINGYVLIELGVEPCQRSKVLNHLLGLVIDEKVPNTKEDLINAVHEYVKRN